MWYVEHLLLNKDEIKNKHDLNSDEFNDLILVEKTLDKMLLLFSKNELMAIDYYYHKVLISKTKKQKSLLYGHFRTVCKKVASVLGDVFTDSGYVDYMSCKYNLDEDQIERLKSYMESVYRHTILSKPYKEI